VLSPGRPLGEAPVPIEPGVDVLGTPGWLVTGEPDPVVEDPVVEGVFPEGVFPNVAPPARLDPTTPGTPPPPGLALIPPLPPPVAPPVADD